MSSATPSSTNDASNTSGLAPIYADESLVITLAQNPCQITDLQITPVSTAPFTQLDGQTCGYLFTCATVLSSVLFDAVKCDATMFLLFETPQQTTMRILSRSQNDGLFTQLNRKEAQLDELTALAQNIASNIIVYEKPQDSKPALDTLNSSKTSSTPSKKDSTTVDVKSDQNTDASKTSVPIKKPVYEYYFKRVA
jgi:hypothetical protein